MPGLRTALSSGEESTAHPNLSTYHNRSCRIGGSTKGESAGLDIGYPNTRISDSLQPWAPEEKRLVPRPADIQPDDSSTTSFGANHS